jgi:hypothetical protein
MEFLERLGYTCRVIKNAWWRLLIPEQRPIEHNRWFIAEKRMRMTATSTLIIQKSAQTS